MSKPKNKKTLFIVFEGGERVGKSTAIKSVRRKLLKLGYRVAPLTHEPGGTILGKRIRKLLKYSKQSSAISPKAEALLFFADRAQHVEQLISPQLQSGEYDVVLCDRYSASTMAYQGSARKLDVKDLEWIDRWSKNNLEPDLYILFDIDPRIAHRRGLNPNDRIESEKLDFHNRLRKGFLNQASNTPKQWRVIDATQEKGVVAQEVLRVVIDFLDKR